MIRVGRLVRPLRSVAAAGVLAALVAGTPAGACTITVTSVAFGTYDSISPANDDSTGTLIAACHPSVHAPEVWISAGSAGSIMSRSMRNGAVTLNYNLYADAARTMVWGDGTTGTSVALSGGSVSAGERRFTRPIYGRIPGLQPVVAGAYIDTLIVTVVF
jgi:spore coat protein U-like protein